MDRVALITGAGRGIGAATALLAASRGYAVCVNYLRNEAAARGVVDAITAAGGRAIAMAGDVSQEADVVKLFEAVDWELGTVTALVNNACILERQMRLEAMDAARIRRVLDTNLVGPANVCYLAARHMIENGGGRIVNVSSRGAFRGEPEGPAYGASKAGLNSMSQSLAQRLAPHKIFVGVVAPGWTETDLAARVLETPQGDAIRAQSPLNRVATPQEVAYAVLFLASDGAEFATGAVLDVNGASYLR